MSTQTYQNSVTLTDAVEFNRFDTAAYCYLTGVAGTNTITAAGPANMVLTAPQVPVILVPSVTNTGATTLNITPSGGSVLGAKNVFSGGAACVGGELVAGVPVAVVYDGTQFNIMGIGMLNTSFAATATGGTTAPANPMYVTKNGPLVTLDFPSGLNMTSNATTITLTGMPAAYWPAGTKKFPIFSINNGGTEVAAVAQIQTTGVITLYPTAASASPVNWTNGNMNVQQFTFTYNRAV